MPIRPELESGGDLREMEEFYQTGCGRLGAQMELTFPNDYAAGGHKLRQAPSGAEADTSSGRSLIWDSQTNARPAPEDREKGGPMVRIRHTPKVRSGGIRDVGSEGSALNRNTIVPGVELLEMTRLNEELVALRTLFCYALLLNP
ncbi:unnamed protein product [Protopolystoma xenopodis]|uniref:Uncharacterized protein n=1 Tax=Protopolystoma xenopodis TaxID=117903 RepID=A0A448WKF0_9PLAT|nr:unnamed protein product [Protopolystoma xenopodis]